MLFMLIVKATKNSEAGKLPCKELREAMDRYNDDLVNAGVRVMAKGLHPSSDGLRLSFVKPKEAPIVTKGPFQHPNELIAGFFILEVSSQEEAIQWAMKAPDPQGYGEGQLELRQVY